VTHPTIISFYTRQYEEHADAFVEACTQFTLPVDIQLRDCRGRWEANCNQKSEFVGEMLVKHQGPVVWIDIDGRVRSEPTLFPHLAHEGVDFAAFFIPNVFRDPKKRPWGPTRGPEALAGGTMYFDFCPQTAELVEAWKDRCRKYPRVWEQQNLQAVVHDVPGLKMHVLPQAYCKVFDQPWYSGEGPPCVVEHLMASRKLRRTIR
jgi:hypothetical protein